MAATEPGRDARGRFVRDDRNLVEAVRLLCGGLDKLGDALTALAMDAATRIALAGQARQAAADAQAWLDQTDTGPKPSGGPDERGGNGGSVER